MKTENDILPELRPILLGCEPCPLREDEWPAQVKPYALDPIPGVTVRQDFAPRTGGGSVRVLVITPENAQGVLPGLLWIHGGGYFCGLPEDSAQLCADFALKVGCVVVAPDYRLAPQNPYPAGLEDCYDALLWMAGNAGALGVDASRLAVAGQSAGGGLTAALTLLNRDRNGPKLVFQMPLCPMLDDRNETASCREITGKTFPRCWNSDQNFVAWRWYLREVQGEPPIYAAPARADDLTGLPPAYLLVGDFDPFRDETIAYAAKLSQAEVPVELHLYPYCFHGFETAGEGYEVSRRAMGEIYGALRRAFAI